jgi:hypothetical protein
MSVGNWKTHILVDCAKCHKLMGWHIETKTAVCNECKAVGKEIKKAGASAKEGQLIRKLLKGHSS